MTENDCDDAIDALITWVDGGSAAHRERRAQYMAQSVGPLHENALNPHRWVSGDEIYFCLQSIHNHAPWIRTIWILVEDETPDLTRFASALRAKIRVAYHRDIFDGFEGTLPTFNSLAIESMMWRIEGLAERFLYFNDDVFLTGPLAPQDMFEGDKPVLRGRWVDYSDLLRTPELRDDPAKFHDFMQINAAALCGVGAERLFAAAHVVHPMRRSIMARLYAQHRDAFIANIGHRFRDLGQFFPPGLHNHACLASGQAVLTQARDHLHIASGQGAGAAPSGTRELLTQDALAQVKFLCVNDLPQLEKLVPEARTLIAQAIGGFA